MLLTNDCLARDMWIGLQNLFFFKKEVKETQADNEFHVITVGDLNMNNYFSKVKTHYKEKGN